MPNRYEPAPGLIGRFDLAARRTRATAISVAPRLCERVLFSSRATTMSQALRSGAARMLRGRIAAIRHTFDASFYLSQLEAGERRRAAGQDPLLHYLTVGWMEERSPHPAFDPSFYRRETTDLAVAADPYFHYSTRPDRVGVARNEFEKEAATRTSLAGDGEAVFTFHHARGGGSSEYLARYEAALHASGRRVLRVRAVAGAPHLAVVDDLRTEGRNTQASVFDLKDDLAALKRFGRASKVSLIVVNHTIDRPPAVLQWVTQLAADLGCGYEAILHDYFAVCPRVDLVTGYGRHCGVAETSICIGCVSSHGSQMEDVGPGEWRTMFSSFLRGAARIVAPSRDLAARLAPHFPGREVSIWEPERDPSTAFERTPMIGAQEPLRLATLGALNVPKGARVVLALAREIAATKAPVALTVIGSSSDAGALRRFGVTVLGRYRRENLDGLIEKVAPHAILLPAIWPETWSFILTAALERSLPVVAFDIGAPAERLRRLGLGHLLPLELSERPAELAAELLALRRRWVR